MGHAYREQRSTHASSIRKFGDLSVARNFTEACKKVPDYMTQEDWKFLVTLVASPEFQVLSPFKPFNPFTYSQQLISIKYDLSIALLFFIK